MIVEDRDRKIEELRNTGEDVDVLVIIINYIIITSGVIIYAV